MVKKLAGKDATKAFNSWPLSRYLPSLISDCIGIMEKPNCSLQEMTAGLKMHHLLGGAARNLVIAFGIHASSLAKSLPIQPAEKTCSVLLQSDFLTGGLQVI